MNERSVPLKIKNMQENMKKIIITTQTTSKCDLVKYKVVKDKVPVDSNPIKIVENKTKRSKKGLMEYDMGYDIVEDIKETKVNISLFELCNLPVIASFFFSFLLHLFVI